MRRVERPPILDYLVFGTALVLAVIVGYYAVVRRPWSRPVSAYEPPIETAAPAVTAEATPNTIEGSGTRDLATETPGMRSSGRSAAPRARR